MVSVKISGITGFNICVLIYHPTTTVSQIGVLPWACPYAEKTPNDQHMQDAVQHLINCSLAA